MFKGGNITLKILFILIPIFLIFQCTGCNNLTLEEKDNYEYSPILYIVLTVDAEEKEDLLGIHGGIMDKMLDIFEEQGLQGRVEILMPVDDWSQIVKDNLSIANRINSYPISLHCDQHAKFTYQPMDVQKKRINSSISWIKENFNYSGKIFRAPTLEEGETTRDVLNMVGGNYDLTPQIYASKKTVPFFPVLIRENLSLLPTTFIVTGGFPDYSLEESIKINAFYMRSFDDLLLQAEEGPVVGVALLHPTNWNNESLKFLKENIKLMKSKPNVRFITADEISGHIPLLGKNAYDFSPDVGIVVEPREDYDPNKTSFNDESFLLYSLKIYGLNVERANLSELEKYDKIIYYSPIGEIPKDNYNNLIVLDSGKLWGVEPESLMNPNKGKELPEDLQIKILNELVHIEFFSLRALEEAKLLGETPYLEIAIETRDPYKRLRFAYLSYEYSKQIGNS